MSMIYSVYPMVRELT